MATPAGGDRIGLETARLAENCVDGSLVKDCVHATGNGATETLGSLHVPPIFAPTAHNHRCGWPEGRNPTTRLRSQERLSPPLTARRIQHRFRRRRPALSRGPSRARSGPTSRPEKTCRTARERSSAAAITSLLRLASTEPRGAESHCRRSNSTKDPEAGVDLLTTTPRAERTQQDQADPTARFSPWATISLPGGASPSTWQHQEEIADHRGLVHLAVDLEEAGCIGREPNPGRLAPLHDEVLRMVSLDLDRVGGPLISNAGVWSVSQSKCAGSDKDQKPSRDPCRSNRTPRRRVPKALGPQEEAPLGDDDLAGPEPAAHRVGFARQLAQADLTPHELAFLVTGRYTTERSPTDCRDFNAPRRKKLAPRLPELIEKMFEGLRDFVEPAAQPAS